MLLSLTIGERKRCYTIENCRVANESQTLTQDLEFTDLKVVSGELDCYISGSHVIAGHLIHRNRAGVGDGSALLRASIDNGLDN